MRCSFAPMIGRDARAIRAWRYDDLYAVCSMEGTPEALAIWRQWYLL